MTEPHSPPRDAPRAPRGADFTPASRRERAALPPDYEGMEGTKLAGDATFQELVLNQLMSLQADLEAIKEAEILLLKVLVNFPTGQTPQRWLETVREKAVADLELRYAALRSAVIKAAVAGEAAVEPRIADTVVTQSPAPPPVTITTAPTPAGGTTLRHALLHFVRGRS